MLLSNIGNFVIRDSKLLKDMTCFGYNSKVSADNCIAIGSGANATHYNSVVIGTNHESTLENSVNINGLVFTKDTIHMDKLNITNKLTFIASNDTNEYLCEACDCILESGIKFTDHSQCHGLCFSCIFETTLQFKARERWIAKTGDPITQLMQQVTQLTNDVKELRDEMNKR